MSSSLKTADVTTHFQEIGPDFAEVCQSQKQNTQATNVSPLPSNSKFCGNLFGCKATKSLTILAMQHRDTTRTLWGDSHGITLVEKKTMHPSHGNPTFYNNVACSKIANRVP